MVPDAKRVMSKAKMQPHEPISKLDAATRQLDLAIRLFFDDADPIGVHTLAGAAHGILCGLRAHGGRHHGPRVRLTPKERANRRLVERNVAEAKNFLKHADRDPSKILYFHPNWKDFLLYDAIAMHIRLSGNITTSSIFFLVWVSAKYPELMLFDRMSGAKELMDRLRLAFPALGDVGVQKRTFRAAMNRRESPRVTA
jgi:hypothetical protein